MFLDTIFMHQLASLPYISDYLNALSAAPRTRPIYNFTEALQSVPHHELAIIAEFKRRSPSNPHLHPHADPIPFFKAYAQGGAAAVSILTESCYFGGQYADLANGAKHLNIPILNKDFIIHPDQVTLAHALGADAILLIAELQPLVNRHIEENPALMSNTYKQLIDHAHGLGLQVLMEVHSAEAYQTVQHLPFDVLGINNRNLQTLVTDLATTENLLNTLRSAELEDADSLPDTFRFKGPIITESGLRQSHQARAMKALGLSAALIGESLMTSQDPEALLTSYRTGKDV